MRRLINALVIVLIVIVGAGLFAMMVLRTRASALLVECKYNLKVIGQGIHSYSSVELRFPFATVPNKEIPPEKRLSWQVAIIPHLDQIGFEIDLNKPWDSEENLHPKWVYRDEGKVWKEETNGTVNRFRCPANPRPVDHEQLDQTNLVGIAGLGKNAAELREWYPQVGMFGYDRRADLRTLFDGNCMMVVETTYQNGPWTAGGFPTVRGLDTDGPPYLGANGQFSSKHAHCSGSLFSSPATNVLFADGSVRSFTESLDPRLFEAMATISGHEGIDRLGDQ